MKKIILLATAVMSFSALADYRSDLDAVQDQYQLCLANPESNAQMKVCASDAYEGADRLLNAVYGQIRRGLQSRGPADQKQRKEETLRRLVSAQRAWITYRDSNCRLHSAGSIGGSMESLEFVDCIYEATKARTIELLDLQSYL